MTRRPTPQRDRLGSFGRAWLVVRDPVIVVTALALIVLESRGGISHPERLTAYLAMLGLPLVLRRDAKGGDE
jgi:hypothetical protein